LENTARDLENTKKVSKSFRKNNGENNRENNREKITKNSTNLESSQLSRKLNLVTETSGFYFFEYEK